jgi:adenylate kinase family enzyme
MDLKRTIVIGNSGSGKSWLAERVADNLTAPWVDLDLIHWEPGGYDIARNNEQAIALTRRAAASDSWVIEGIYGWLVREAESNATALVWLCIEETECVANIRNRGIRRGGHEDAFNALLQWAETYRTRKGSSSYSAHKEIFDNFPGSKSCLRYRSEVTAFAHLDRLHSC